MNDAFLDKLKQRNISNNTETTKERVEEIWKNADKKSKQELMAFTGHGMYATISKITKSGRITAKMAIILSRYLNINPFYLVGESDKRMNYSDDLLKDFLLKLGYKKLWTEYSKHSTINETSDENEADEKIITNVTSESIKTDEEKHDIEEKFDNYIKDALKETADIYDKENENPLISLNIVNETIDISTETLNIMNKLTEEEIITLLKALLIRAKVKNSNSQQIADQIKLKLLLN